MALHLEILKNLYGYSLAKYATWLYYKPDNLLFDVGEGVSLAMRNKLYAIDTILISHGHGDHIAGLPGLLSSRASSMGDQNKPLTIYYPQGDRNVLKLRCYIEDGLGYLPFSINWREITEGQKVALAKNRSFATFLSDHNANTLTLGYKIIEHRSRLKKEYRDLPLDQLLEYIRVQGKENLSEKYECTLLCYSGDSMPLDVEIIKEAQVLIHDSTFLQAEDREENTHACLDEVLAIAIQANVEAVGLMHFSARYHRNHIIAAIRRNIQALQIRFPIFYLFPQPLFWEFKKIDVEEFPKNGKTRTKRENGPGLSE